MKLTPVEAYDRWAATYDEQPDNVVLALESPLFSEMLERVAIEGKVVVDVGCGTGRHWREILARRPAELIGLDPSSQMLERLKANYPESRVLCAPGDDLAAIADASCDVIVSTLALAHIPDPSRAISEWSRKLRNGGAILVTDFHPGAIHAGMERTFAARGQTIEIEHHAISLDRLREIAAACGLVHAATMDRVIGESVRPLYERAKYLDAYEKHKGTPLVFGLHFLKSS